MDYLQLQADARDENRTLLAAFAVIIAIVAAAAAAVVTATGWATLWLLEVIIANDAASTGRQVAESELLLDRTPWGWVYVAVFAVTASVMVWVSHARERALIDFGGHGIARSLGGRRIDGTTTDRAERRFVNAVEEMAIAARRPAPSVFVLDRERSINAFNAGWTDDTTAIGITGGALASLRREELQAVAAQAMAHVFHGDARLNLRLMALVTGVAGLAIVGEDWIERSKPDGDGEDDGVFLPLMVAGSLLYAVGWIGVWLSNQAQRSVARRHELLADATAVELLRQSEPVRDALRRVGGHPRRGRVRHRHARSMNHLFMVDAGTSRRGGLHPDLRLRILRLDPGWNGQWLRPDAGDQPTPVGPGSSPGLRPATGAAPPPAVGLGPLRPVFDAMAAPIAGLDTAALGGGHDGALAAGGLMAPMMAAAVLDEVSGPAPTAVEIDEARTTAAALVHLGAGKAPTRDSVPAPCSVEAVVARIDGLRQSSDIDRPAIMTAAGAALRAAADGPSFVRGLASLLDVDDDLDQWILSRLLLGNVAPPADRRKRRSLERMRGDYATVLSVLTAIGGGDGATAFAVGVARADLLGLHPRQHRSLGRLDRALSKLSSMSEDDHHRALAGLTASIEADGVRRRSELEFVEVVRLAIDPPRLHQRTTEAAAFRPASTRRSWRSRLRARSV